MRRGWNGRCRARRYESRTRVCLRTAWARWCQKSKRTRTIDTVADVHQAYFWLSRWQRQSPSVRLWKIPHPLRLSPYQHWRPNPDRPTFAVRFREGDAEVCRTRKNKRSRTLMLKRDPSRPLAVQVEWWGRTQCFTIPPGKKYVRIGIVRGWNENVFPVGLATPPAPSP